MIGLYAGERRTLYPGKCVTCGKRYYRPKKNIGKYCSLACRPRKSVECVCGYCNETFIRSKSKITNSRSGINFCSRKCKDRAQRYESGVDGAKPKTYIYSIISYRRRAIRFYGAVCSECGYSDDSRMLDAHHLDGNRKNNAIENLRVLCVWCHALETRKDWPKSGN